LDATLSRTVVDYEAKIQALEQINDALREAFAEAVCPGLTTQPRTRLIVWLCVDDPV
jgi:hypothetical protein